MLHSTEIRSRLLYRLGGLNLNIISSRSRFIVYYYTLKKHSHDLFPQTTLNVKFNCGYC